MPAHGAVAQGHHRVRHAGVAQGLGPQDAARATGAVDHHLGFRIGRQGGDTVVNSAPGQLMPPGMLIRLNSAIGRESKITISAPLSIMRRNSVASTEGVSK